LGWNVEEVVVKSIWILKRAILGPIEKVLCSVLTVDLYDWRWSERRIPKRRGQNISINIWLGETLSISRDGDKRGCAAKAEDGGDTVWVDDKVTIMDQLEASIESPSKLVLASISTSRGVGLDGLPCAVKVIWSLNVLRILETKLVTKYTVHTDVLTSAGGFLTYSRVVCQLMYGSIESRRAEAADWLNGTEFRHSYASSAGTVGVAALGDAATRLATLAHAFGPVPDVVGLAVVVTFVDEREDEWVFVVEKDVE